MSSRNTEIIGEEEITEIVGTGVFEDIKRAKAKSKEEISRMVAEEEEGTIHLAQADQEFLDTANGTKTLSEIANQLGYNRRKLVTVLSFLLTNGFLDIISTDQRNPFNDNSQAFMPELD